MRMSTVPVNRLQLKRRSARLPLNALVRLAGQDHQRGATETPARIVTQVRSGQGIFTYGVEFLESDATKDFWGIAFPPVESRGATGQVAEKSGIVRRRRGIPSHER